MKDEAPTAIDPLGARATVLLTTGEKGKVVLLLKCCAFSGNRLYFYVVGRVE